MQTDILEIMQPDILGMKLTSVPVTFMDKEGGDNTTNSSDETLTAKIKNMSCASPRDTKNKSPLAIRKWKKKEWCENTEMGPIQTQSEIYGDKPIGQKR